MYVFVSNHIRFPISCPPLRLCKPSLKAIALQAVRSPLSKYSTRNLVESAQELKTEGIDENALVGNGGGRNVSIIAPGIMRKEHNFRLSPYPLRLPSGPGLPVSPFAKLTFAGFKFFLSSSDSWDSVSVASLRRRVTPGFEIL
jgi:hypothetical protein